MLILATLVLFPVQAVSADTGSLTQPPELDAVSAIVMDAVTGQVLYGKNETQQMEPASLTKLMTYLLALQLGDKEDIVTTTSDALRLMRFSTSISLKEGETLTMEELLYALMLPSANDAANAIAIHIAGSLNNFVNFMNEEVEWLGLTGTQFRNVHGLPAAGHYTTAYDLAQITRSAMQYPDFYVYSGAASYTIPATNKSAIRELAHTNQMLNAESDFYYEGSLAGKTGWTVAAGRCLLTIVERDGRTLICIILKSDGESGSHYADSVALLDYAFENYELLYQESDDESY